MNWFNIRNAAATVAEISIYGPIGSAGISAARFADEIKRVTAKEITLRIHSPGGSILDGHAIFNAIQRHPAKVTSIVDGLAASMATVVALAGSRVQIAANGIWMIHNPSGATEGTSKGMRELADILDKLAAQIVDIYAAKTGKPREEIVSLMEAETWMTAEEAKAFGFVDEIIPARKAKASVLADFDLSAFAHAPAPPADAGKEIYDEYQAHMKEGRNYEATVLWGAHQNVLIAYAEEISSEAEPLNRADVSLLRAELSAATQRADSVTAELATAREEIATLQGQAKTAQQRAQEIAAAFGGEPARQDPEVCHGHADGKRIYDRYQALMKEGKGIEATKYWNAHEDELIAYAASLES